MFYIVTVGGILSACLRTLVGSPVLTGESLQRLILAGIVVGWVSGLLLGLYVIRGRLAAVLCSCVGILVGAVAGALALVRAEYFGEIAAIAFFGCWIMVLAMLISARFAKPF